MKKYFTLAISLLLVFALVIPSMAATYDFTVIYSGGGSASLAPGSDDPLSTTLNPGDDFTYILQAAGAGEWSSISAGSIFPFFSLIVSPSGVRLGDFTLDLLNDGSSVFTFSDSNVTNQLVHLGTNSVVISSGLVFDTFRLDYSFISGDAATPVSLLPWPGNQGPEEFNPLIIAFNANPVPEPSTLLLLGSGLVGLVGFRRKFKK